MELQPALKGQCRSQPPLSPRDTLHQQGRELSAKGGGSEQSLVPRPYPSGTWMFLQAQPGAEVFG